MTDSDPEHMEIETADEYGRQEQCFQDYRGDRFGFHQHTSYFRGTAQRVGPDGLLGQSGLRSSSIPRPNLTAETMDLEYEVAAFLSIPKSPPILPLLGNFSTYKDFLLPVTELDIGCHPEADVKKYSDMLKGNMHCDLNDHWLPLSSIRFEKDEGLSMPAHSRKLQWLLRRELEREQIVLSSEALAFTEAACNSQFMPAIGSLDICTRMKEHLLSRFT